MKVYELMKQLESVPAGREVRVSIAPKLSEMEPIDADTLAYSGTVVMLEADDTVVTIYA